MKTRNLLVIGGSFVLILVGYIWFFVYNKPHIDYSEEKAEYVGHADSLHDEAVENQDKFHTDYVNKAVEVKGVVTEVGNTSFTIGTGMICTVDSAHIADMPLVGDTVTVKGRVVGTDEDILTAEIICTLDKCVFLNR